MNRYCLFKLGEPSNRIVIEKRHQVKKLSTVYYSPVRPTPIVTLVAPLLGRFLLFRKLDQVMEAVQNNNLALAMRPVRPEGFDGSRDYLKVNAWLYKMLQYFTLVRATSHAELGDVEMITFASSLLKDGAAVWWYTLQVANLLPGTWAEFEAAIRTEFIPEDHVRAAREQLKNCRQTESVTKYVSAFRNATLLVPDLSAGDKWDKFVEGLKPNIAFEVRKDNCMTFEDAARVAVRIEAALNGSLRTAWEPMGSEPTPMEIGNVEIKNRREKKRLTNEEYALVRKKACFICKKKGCRSWRNEKKPVVNAIGVQKQDEASSSSSSESSDSEN